MNSSIWWTITVIVIILWIVWPKRSRYSPSYSDGFLDAMLIDALLDSLD